MPAERLSMRKVREVLRLRHTLKRKRFADRTLTGQVAAVLA